MKARRKRDGAAIGASVLAHVVVFAIIGLNVPKLITPNYAPLDATNIWLMPRLTPLAHTPPKPKPAERAPAPAAAPTPIAKQAKAPPSPVQAQPAAPPARPAPGVVKGLPASPGPEGGSVQEALRTSVGCDFDKVVHLNPGEKDHCNQTAGLQARAAPAFIGIDPLKRGRFDLQADADERRRAAREQPMQQLVVPCSGEGSNLGGGCLPSSAIMHVHQN